MQFTNQDDRGKLLLETITKDELDKIRDGFLNARDDIQQQEKATKKNGQIVPVDTKLNVISNDPQPSQQFNPQPRKQSLPTLQQGNSERKLQGF